jgi:hypothetical protein
MWIDETRCDSLLTEVPDFRVLSGDPAFRFELRLSIEVASTPGLDHVARDNHVARRGVRALMRQLLAEGLVVALAGSTGCRCMDARVAESLVVSHDPASRSARVFPLGFGR